MSTPSETVAAWSHQIRGVEAVRAARAEGHRIIILTSPTGGGKSRMACDLIDLSLAACEKVVLYTNRKMLTEQTIRVMLKHGIHHGVRAAGWEPNLTADVQVASIQTESSKVKRWQRSLHEANLVIVDEGHLQKSGRAEQIFQRHLDAGADIVLITATPIDMGNICGIKPHLVVAGTNSELRKCGALVAAQHYGCSEPDVRTIRKQILEFSEGDVRKVMMVPGVFARVLDEFQRLNPRQLPTLLFAPAVAESMWFAEEFRKAGIRSAHIDGKDCWLDGEFYRTSQEIRDRIVGLLKAGEVKVLTNRFVLREGLDLPFLRHIIIATIFTTLQGYLQSLGRGLRVDRDHETVERFGPKAFLTVADHGGCWHRHGSLNVDRTWELEYTLSENAIQGLRQERMRDKEEKEPFLCPQCKKVLTSNECRNCGLKVTRKSRPVVQADGTIRLYEGDIYLPHKVSMKSDRLKNWEHCYYRMKNSKNGMTFNQARGLFVYEQNYWPPSDLPLMPMNRLDWYRAVKDVPREALVGYATGPE